MTWATAYRAARGWAILSQEKRYVYALRQDGEWCYYWTADHQNVRRVQAARI